MQRRDLIKISGAVAMLNSTFALAQGKVNPISIIVPIGGGSGGDTAVRVLAEEISRKINNTVIVDNKPGADNMIAANHVLSGPTNGSRVLFTSPSSMVLLPILNPNSDFQPEKQLEPIITSSIAGTALAVGKKYQNLDDLVKAAIKNPGGISVATYGGHYFKLLALMIEQELGVKFNHVPYKSPAPAMNDVAGGTVDAMLIDISGVREWHLANKIKAVAVTNENRFPSLKDVPTFKEMGYPELVSYIWVGFAVKSGTPHNIIQNYYNIFSEALDSKSYKDYLASGQSGSEVVNYNPEKTKEFLNKERQRFTKLVKQTGYSI